MKIKSWINYFIYMLVILIIVFLGLHVSGVIKKYAEVTFDYKRYYIMIIFYVGLGLLLGLEHLIKEFKKEGTWKINLPKIVFMGVPSLYFSLALFILYNIQGVLLIPITVLMLENTGFIYIFQLILGYSIVTSFYKSNENI